MPVIVTKEVDARKLDMAIEFTELMYLALKDEEYHHNGCAQCARLNARMVEVESLLGKLVIHMKELRGE